MTSNGTGEALAAGERNRANFITWIIGCAKDSGGDNWWPTQQPDGQPRWDPILMVTPSGVSADIPAIKLDGIVGQAHLGGAGVRGRGGQPELPGGGGDGVVGEGGSGRRETQTHPGVGVLGIGGHWTGALPSKEMETPLGGAGVVGVAGGAQAPFVADLVFAQGTGVFGYSDVGDGVSGIGVSNGVTAGGQQNGLRATGRFGVVAIGENTGTYSEGIAIGLHAVGKKGPGGFFERLPQLPPGKAVGDHVEFYEMGALPQIAIKPMPMVVPDAIDIGEGAQMLVMPPDQVDQLPRNANAGELLLTMKPLKSSGVSGFEDGAEAFLWLCVKPNAVATGGKTVAAVWKQVLLGPPIEGQRDNP